MKKTPLVIALMILMLGTPVISTAQKEKIDSLKQELALQTDDSSRLAILYPLVYAISEVDEVEEMYRYLDKMEELVERSNDIPGTIKFYLQRARLLFSRSFEYDSALHYGYKGLALLNEYGSMKLESTLLNYYILLGLLYKNMDEYDSAIHYYSKIVKWSNMEFKDLVYIGNLNMSNMYRAMGNHEKALEYAFNMVDMARNVYQEEDITPIQSTIADLYYSQKSYQKALQLIDLVIKYDTENNPERISAIYHHSRLKGKCLIGLGRYAEAKQIFERDLQYQLKIYGEGHAKLIDPYLNLGWIQRELRDFDGALDYFSKALLISEAFGSKWHFDILKSIGDTYLELGKNEDAIKQYTRAKEFVGNHPLHNASLFLAMGDSYKQQKKNHEALKAYDQAFIRLSPDETPPVLEDLGRNWHNVLLLQKCGLIFETLYESEGNVGDIKNSLSSYLMADSLIVELRNLYKQQEDKININELFTNTYKGGVRVSTKLHELTNDQQYLDLAFYFSEMSKSSVLYTSILKRDQMHYTTLPDSLIAQENDLKSKIQFHQSKLVHLAAKKNSEKISQFKNTLLAYKLKYENLQQHLEKNYIDYYTLTHEAKVLTIEQVQKKLSKSQTLIEFSLERESLVAFIIDKRGFHLMKTPIPVNLDEMILDFRSSITNFNQKESKYYGRKLYDVIFSPISSYVKADEVIIVPEGILWYLNFELLINDKKETSGPAYLVYDYAISYGNSANQLFFETNADESFTEPVCLAFSYSESDLNIRGEAINFNTIREDEDLPGTTREINNIASIVPGVYYYGEEANEKNFKKIGKNYSILHLAVHGQIDDLDPDNSRLKFSGISTDTLEDNYLHAFELYNMKLNAKLAVLSACNTGTGRLAKGEGIMSLGRAFQYAGVKSLLISNWVVLDQVAPELMKYFYQNLSQGMTKSRALQKAKIEFLATASPRLTQPYFWGPFTIIGDDSPVFEKDIKSIYPHIALILFLMLVVVLLVYRKRLSLR